MTIKVAKRILKNKENLKYNAQQIKKAETIMRRYQKNKKED